MVINGYFLKDVFWCSLGAYGGPEAHYGVFSSYLVENKGYVTDEELAEWVGLFSLVPGPSSTQTMMAIGYHVGGPILALLTLLVWIMPAVLIMTGVGVFFQLIKDNALIEGLLTFLPVLAVAFIWLAAYNMTKKVIHSNQDVLIYIVMLVQSILLSGISSWFVPILLLLGGFLYNHINRGYSQKVFVEKVKLKYYLLLSILGIAIFLNAMSIWLGDRLFLLLNAIYRYGYSIMGGGQVMIPLMIQDLVVEYSFLTEDDFLSGYAIDQAVPGPLFSFAAFVAAKSIDNPLEAILAGLLGGFLIFLPGALLVYFIYPFWKTYRTIPRLKLFLKGVSLTAAALVTMVGVQSFLNLERSLLAILVLISSISLLLTKRIAPTFLVVLVALFGLLWQNMNF